MPGESALVAQWGAWGVIVVGLGYAVVHLWRRLNEIQLKLEAEHLARLTDAKDNTKAMLELAERSTDAINGLHDLVQDVKEVLRKLPSSRP